MTKFCLSESESVIASLRDPVALDCISKLTQNAADSSAVSTNQQLEQDCSVGQTTEESLPHLNVDELPSCSAKQDTSTVTPLTAIAMSDASDYDVKLLVEGVGAVTQQTTVASDIPVFIASHDLLSLPLITLPLVACGIASRTDVSTLNQAASPEKSFVTIAAVSELNSLPENVVIKPAENVVIKPAENAVVKPAENAIVKPTYGTL